jgi:hypothetical protein
VYLVGLLIAWILPAVAIARRNHFLAVVYLVVTTLSIPGLLALDIGQPEIFLYVLAIPAFFLITRRPRTSAALLGVAIAIKPYMALFLLIYLFRKEYRLALRAIAIALAVNFVTALYILHGSAFSLHIWDTILHDSFGYGSGNGLKLWDNAPFLRSNASLFGFLYVFGAGHLPVVGASARLLVHHYTAFSFAVLAGMLGVLWRIRSRLSLELQWIYLACVFLLIPSFTIGYAWLLLFVPFVSLAMTRRGNGLHQPGRLGLLESRSLLVTLALSVAAYPANIALPASLAASQPRLGPSGNSILTPALLVVALVLIVSKSANKVRAADTITPDLAPRSARVRRRLNWSVGASAVAVLCSQIAGCAIAYGLSAASPAPNVVTARDWVGTWIRAKSQIPKGSPNAFKISLSGQQLVGVFPWPGCVNPSVASFGGKFTGDTVVLTLLSNVSSPQGDEPIVVGTQTLTMSANKQKIAGWWTATRVAGSCRPGSGGYFSATRSTGVTSLSHS